MRLVGVIAEYNPFHNGHAYHLREAKRISQADAVVVVLSTWMTQRGDAALFSPADRARMALQCGADAVFGLPALYAVRDAEHYALAGVHLLTQLGCSAISFGMEAKCLEPLQAIASLLEGELPSMAQAALDAALARGLAWPKALSVAVETVLPGSAAIMAAPNNILAICYLRAIQRLHSPLTVCALRRSGAGYHATAVSEAYPSASALRSALCRGDWPALSRGLPPEALAIAREAVLSGRVCPPDALDQALLYRLREMDASAWAALPGLSEGIEQRMQRAAQGAVSRQELLTAAHTARYPSARLNRLCAHALLGLTSDALDAAPLPSAVQLLAFRREAAPLLRQINQGGYPILSRAGEMMNAAPWLAAEKRAADLWALGAGLPAGLLLRQAVVKI